MKLVHRGPIKNIQIFKINIIITKPVFMLINCYNRIHYTTIYI